MSAEIALEMRGLNTDARTREPQNYTLFSTRCASELASLGFGWVALRNFRRQLTDKKFLKQMLADTLPNSD
jgi:hypothetical protein